MGLNVTDIGPDYLFSQENRNNRSTANPTGIEVRRYLNLSSQNNHRAAEQILLGLSKDNRKDLNAIMSRNLKDAVTALQNVPGLWVALGLHRTSIKGCDDVSIFNSCKAELHSRLFSNESIILKKFTKRSCTS
jgi:hypothetical protein